MLDDDQSPDELVAMLRSSAWAQYRARVEATIRDKQCELERSLPIAETEHARGYIAALRRVMEIPQILVQEMEASGGN